MKSIIGKIWSKIWWSFVNVLPESVAYTLGWLFLNFVSLFFLITWPIWAIYKRFNKNSILVAIFCAIIPAVAYAEVEIGTISGQSGGISIEGDGTVSGPVEVENSTSKKVSEPLWTKPLPKGQSALIYRPTKEECEKKKNERDKDLCLSLLE